MKRCPQCNRVESDNTLSFCRIDGTTLLRDTGSVDANAGTIRFDSSTVASELDTSVLPQKLTTPVAAEVTAPAVNAPPILQVREKFQGGHKRKWWLPVVVMGPLLVAIAIGVYLNRFRAVTLPPIQSVAVMPFINASGNTDAEYLSDGMTETLINNLSQLPNLSVKARSSVFRYKGKEVDPLVVGSELSVEAILNGRVIQRGDDLTFYLSLVDTRNGNQIWGEQYVRKQADLISLQNEIGREVVAKLRTKLTGTDEQKIIKTHTQNPDAYQLYLRGRFFWNKRTPQNIRKSIEYFQEAIEKDPNYALGHAGLSDAYALLVYYRGGPAAEFFPKAKAAALRAVALDPNLAESHNALGFVSVLADYDYATAERSYRKAIELNPNYSLSHQNLGVMLNRIGRQSEGSAEIEHALEIEPFSTIVNRLYGDVLTFSRRYDAALAQLKKTVELEPSFPTTHLSLSSLHQITGRYQDTVESLANYLQLSGQTQAATLARDSFARGGWQNYMREMTGPRQPQVLFSYIAASYLVQLGDKDKAFVELEKAFENREWMLLYIKVDPRFDGLHDDPRYRELLRRMRFPE